MSSSQVGQNRFLQAPASRLSFVFAATPNGYNTNSYNTNRLESASRATQQMQGQTRISKSSDGNTSLVGNRIQPKIESQLRGSTSSTRPTLVQSTIRSALISRANGQEQGSPLRNVTTTGNSRLPSPAQQASFCVRRSESQRARCGSQFGYQAQGTASKRPNFARRSSASVSIDTIENQADNETSMKQIEGMPPLKSESYISRLLMSTPGQTKTTPTTTTTTAKASMVSGSSQSCRVSGQSRSNNIKGLASIGTQSSTESGDSSNRKSSVSNSTSSESATTTNSMSGSKLPSASFRIKTETRTESVGEMKNIVANNSPSVSSDEDEDEDDEIEESESEESEDEEYEDDDPTDATSMTQSTGSSQANRRELNNMIQMLSSRSILNESDSSHQMASPNITGSALPKLKQTNGQSRLAKSQSSVLNNKNNIEGFSRATTSTTTTTNNSRLLIEAGSSGINTRLPVRRNSLKSGQQAMNSLDDESKIVNVRARPRSRIIFDPISSQFHLSEQPIDGSDEHRAGGLQSRSLTSSSSSSSVDFGNPSVDKFDESDHDEASMKLLDAQHQIITLKYFPRAEEELNKDNLEAKADNRERKSTKSPVGFALRSLFGLQSSASRESVDVCNGKGNNNNINNRKDIETSLVRRNSLRSEYKSGLSNGDTKVGGNLVSNAHQIGSDLLHKATKKLSASSSSLTSKFKFMPSSNSQANKSKLQSQQQEKGSQLVNMNNSQVSCRSRSHSLLSNL